MAVPVRAPSPRPPWVPRYRFEDVNSLLLYTPASGPVGASMLSARLDAITTPATTASPHDPHPQSHISRRRSRNPLPAGNQSHAEGNASGGGPAAHPARGG